MGQGPQVQLQHPPSEDTPRLQATPVTSQAEVRTMKCGTFSMASSDIIPPHQHTAGQLVLHGHDG